MILFAHKKKKVMDREQCVPITDYHFGQGPIISTELELPSSSSSQRSGLRTLPLPPPKKGMGTHIFFSILFLSSSHPTDHLPQLCAIHRRLQYYSQLHPLQPTISPGGALGERLRYHSCDHSRCGPLQTTERWLFAHQYPPNNRPWQLHLLYHQWRCVQSQNHSIDGAVCGGDLWFQWWYHIRGEQWALQQHTQSSRCS